MGRTGVADSGSGKMRKARAERKDQGTLSNYGNCFSHGVNGVNGFLPLSADPV
jgi:hypothetical protein